MLSKKLKIRRMGCGTSKTKKHKKPTLYMADKDEETPAGRKTGAKPEESVKGQTPLPSDAQAALPPTKVKPAPKITQGGGRGSTRSTTFDSRQFPVDSEGHKRTMKAPSIRKGPGISSLRDPGGGASGGGGSASDYLPDAEGSPASEGFGGRPDLRELLKSAGDRLIMILFYEDACEDCEAMRMLYEEFVLAYPDVIFLEANVHANREIVETLNLKFLPTFLAFRNHLEVGRIMTTDARDIEGLIEFNTVYIPPYVEETDETDEAENK